MRSVSAGAPLRSDAHSAPAHNLANQRYSNRLAPDDTEEARMIPPAHEPQSSTHQPTGVARPEDATRALARVETRGIRFINLEFTDVVGMAKSVTIPASQLRDILTRGRWFDGSAI